MKNYPKVLADVTILRRTLEYLYEHAKVCSADAERYRARALENLTEDGTPDPYCSSVPSCGLPAGGAQSLSRRYPHPFHNKRPRRCRKREEPLG